MSSSSDAYYGYGVLSSLSTEIITTLFPPAGSTQSNTPHSTQDSKPPTSSDPHSSHLESIPNLMEYIAYALYRVRLPDEIVYAALLLLSRLKTLYPAAKGTPTSPHRLFISSLMLSSKMSMDDTYSNKSWVIVGQSLFELAELNRMERELFGFLNWNCCISGQELDLWREEHCPDHQISSRPKQPDTLKVLLPAPSESSGSPGSSMGLTTPSSPSLASPSVPTSASSAASNPWIHPPHHQAPEFQKTLDDTNDLESNLV